MTVKNKKIVPPAPTKLSDAIELALEDLAIVEKHKDYRIDMNSYHTPVGAGDGPPSDDAYCEVCLAGVVMTVTHQVPWETYAESGDFSGDWYLVFRALDRVRVGRVEEALMYMGEAPDINFYWSSRVHSYSDSPEYFKNDLIRIMRNLREDGL